MLARKPNIIQMTLPLDVEEAPFPRLRLIAPSADVERLRLPALPVYVASLEQVRLLRLLRQQRFDDVVIIEHGDLLLRLDYFYLDSGDPHYRLTIDVENGMDELVGIKTIGNLSIRELVCQDMAAYLQHLSIQVDDCLLYVGGGQGHSGKSLGMDVYELWNKTYCRADLVISLADDEEESGDA